jgi:mannosyl-oligosaccharide glucosidase
MMPGPMLSDRLETKQKEFEERYDQIFNVNNKVQVRSVGWVFWACLVLN